MRTLIVLLAGLLSTAALAESGKPKAAPPAPAADSKMAHDSKMPPDAKKPPDGKLPKEAPNLPRVKMVKDIEGSLSEIDTLNFSHLTCATASDCVALPLGHKACGPVGYRVASKKNPKFDTLKQKMEDFKKISMAFQEKHQNDATNCKPEPEPKIECKNTLCRAIAP